MSLECLNAHQSLHHLSQGRFNHKTPRYKFTTGWEADFYGERHTDIYTIIKAKAQMYDG